MNTWLLFKVEEQSKESRQLLCGILAQELHSDDGDGDGDGDGLGDDEKNHEPGCVKCEPTTQNLCFLWLFIYAFVA